MYNFAVGKNRAVGTSSGDFQPNQQKNVFSFSLVHNLMQWKRDCVTDKCILYTDVCIQYIAD